MSELQPDNNVIEQKGVSVVKPNNGYMSVMTMIFFMGLASVVAAVVGYYSAKYFVANAPQKQSLPQVMVLDAGRITDEVLKTHPADTQKSVNESIAKIKARINELKSMGIIVIDRQSVIDAPEGAFINVSIGN